MNGGWIKLFRKIRDNPMWEKEVFTKGQAWIDLLLRACHKKQRFLIGNTIIKLTPGQIFTSEKKLAIYWKWSRHKLRNFFVLLFENGQIGTPKRTSKYTIVTIANWELYQSDILGKDIKKNINGTSTGHQRDTYNNNKNLKNDKESNITESASQEVNLDHIMVLYQKKFPEQRKLYGMAGVVRARDYFDGILEGGHSLEDIEEAINKSTKPAPWDIIKPKKSYIFHPY